MQAVAGCLLGVARAPCSRNRIGDVRCSRHTSWSLGNGGEVIFLPGPRQHCEPERKEGREVDQAGPLQKSSRGLLHCRRSEGPDHGSRRSFSRGTKATVVVGREVFVTDGRTRRLRVKTRHRSLIRRSLSVGTPFVGCLLGFGRQCQRRLGGNTETSNKLKNPTSARRLSNTNGGPILLGLFFFFFGGAFPWFFLGKTAVSLRFGRIWRDFPWFSYEKTYSSP